MSEPDQNADKVPATILLQIDDYNSRALQLPRERSEAIKNADANIVPAVVQANCKLGQLALRAASLEGADKEEDREGMCCAQIAKLPRGGRTGIRCSLGRVRKSCSAELQGRASGKNR